LPPAARAKLVALVGQATDARDATASASRRLGELRQKLDYSDRPPPDAPNIEHEMARLSSVRSAQDRRHRAFADLTANIQAWLTALPPPTALEMARVPASDQPRDGETVLDAITRVRTEIDHTLSVLAVVERAPLPKADLKRLAEQHVEELAKRGQPTVTATAEGLSIKFNGADSWATGSRESAVALLAWLHAGQMISRIWGQIDKLPENPNAMSTDRKQERIADIRGSLDGLERHEEALIERAIREGLDVQRRVDADPMAVLGVIVAKPKRVKAAA
jgi:hypothetical protein